MSTDQTDTGSTADDAESSSTATTSSEGIHISEEELNELSNLLFSFKEILIAHEIRLQALESAGEQAPTAAPPTLHVVGSRGPEGGETTDPTPDVEG